MVEKQQTSGPMFSSKHARERLSNTIPAGRKVAREVSQTFAPGERVADRYRIKQLLGRGGMGEVYEAQDDELAIPVALKALRLDLGRDRQSLSSLKQEVLLARAVTHPYVCRVYDVGRHGGGGDVVWFLTMELLRGETLRERLKRGRMSVTEALPLIEQMVAGLGAAHRSGVVHLDFKSGNVMLVGKTGDERAVVTDFGLARAAGARTAGVVEEEMCEERGRWLVGTPAYMAPEQVRGEEAGPAADIYALGVVLYEMVTGELPFVGATPLETARRRLDEDAPSPRSVVAGLDKRWEDVILRCLSRQPGDRFGRVEEVAEVLAGRLPVVARRFGETTRARHTLPAERDSFVGRVAELEELKERFGAGSRWVTIVGAGGMGKTRLALRFGWESLKEWPGGVWFCDLTEAKTMDGIVSAVAGSLGVPLGKGDPVKQLGHAIAGRGRCLVVLDNFEQVAGHAGETVGRWLERAPEARFVVTSRERLNVRGEEVQTVDSLATEAGVDLFVERARRQRPGFDPQEQEAAAVEEVVRLTDGMPLAIELAAARVRVMTVGQVMERMQERFRLLVGRERGRHASLKAAIDGSWETLAQWEKAAWAQSAVFQGGFTLEAAEAVVDLRPWPNAPWVVDVMQSLVDKSLLRVWAPPPGQGHGGGFSRARFGMYVSLQEYAAAELGREGAIADGGSGIEAKRAAEERHGKWYARYGKEEAIEQFGKDGGEERRRLEEDLENLVTACRRAIDRGDGETATATYRASWMVLELQGPFGAAVELGRQLLASPQLGPEERASTLGVLAQAERLSGRMDESRGHYESALAIHREMGDRRLEGVVLGSLAGLLHEQGQMEEARGLYEAALAIHRELGNRRSEGSLLGNLGGLLHEQGNMEEARLHFEAALAIHREASNRRFEGVVLGNLGVLHWRHGRMEKARSQFEAALAIHREGGNRRSEGIVLGNLGNLLHDQGKMDEARAHYEAALTIHRDVGNRRFEGIVLGNLAGLHHDQGRNEEARAGFDGALAIHHEVGNRYSEGIVLTNLGTLHLDQGLRDEARAYFEEALVIHREVGNRHYEGITLGNLGNLFYQQGRVELARGAVETGEAILRQVDDRIELGKILCARAELEHSCGNIAEAQVTLAEAESLATKSGAGPDSELGRMLAKLRQAVAAKG